MKTLPIAATITVGLALSACGQSNGTTPPPVVRATPAANGGIETMQFSMRIAADMSGKSKAGMGLAGNTPSGLRISYLFEKDNLKARYDIPSKMFPDNQARILLVDQKSRSARLLLDSNLQPDLSMPEASLSEMAKMVTDPSNMGFLDLQHPFKRMTADRFTVLARQAAFDVTSKTPRQLIALRKSDLNGAKQLTKLFFDTEVGAVTQSETSAVADNAKYTSSTTLSYVEVEGVENTVIPYKVNTAVKTELIGDTKLEPVVQGEVSEHLEPNEKLVLKPGEVIVNEYNSSSQDGTVDPNKTEMAQTVEYGDIKVNEVNPDFFTVGGR
jgi:hypothetical protein